MYKFNGGNGAVVCDGCSVIMEQNIPFDRYRKEHSGYDFCEQCLSGLTVVDVDSKDPEYLHYMVIIL